MDIQKGASEVDRRRGGEREGVGLEGGGLGMTVFDGDEPGLLAENLRHGTAAVLRLRGELRLDVVKKPDEGTPHGPREVDRDGVAYLPILLSDSTLKLPMVGECLDAGILADAQWAGLEGVATLSLLLAGGAGEREGRLIERQASGHSRLASTQAPAAAHILLGDLLG